MIECPECGHELSSAASACPNCGFPILRRTPSVPGEAQPIISQDITTAKTEVRPLSLGLSGTVAGFSWAVAVGYAVAGLTFLGTYFTWDSWKYGSGSIDQVFSSENAAFAFLGLAFLGQIVAWILFTIWFYQAYTSAKSRGATLTTWGAGWTIGSWFIPLANFVIPKLVMNEVDKMSNPHAGMPPIGERWKPMPRLFVSDAWWTAWLLAVVATYAGGGFYSADVSYVPDTTGQGYLLLSLAQILLAVAAALMGVVALMIGKRLRRRSAEQS